MNVMKTGCENMNRNKLVHDEAIRGL